MSTRLLGEFGHRAVPPLREGNFEERNNPPDIVHTLLLQ